MSPARPGIPRACARASEPQAIASRAITAVAFESAAWDTDGMHARDANATRLTARTPGLYVITASFEWEPDPLGWRTASLRIDGETGIAYERRLAVRGGETMHAIAAQYLLAAGGYVELLAGQNSGRHLRIGGRSHVETMLAMTWVGS
jgi:hypothetical protein